jgi:hypothetical protein
MSCNMQPHMVVRLSKNELYSKARAKHNESGGSVCSLCVPDEVLANFSPMGVLEACKLMDCTSKLPFRVMCMSQALAIAACNGRVGAV